MKNATRESKFMVATSIKDARKWAKCWSCGRSDFGDIKPIKTFNHGVETCVCKECVNKIVSNVPTLGKETSKHLLYYVSVTTTTDVCKAYLLVNGYKHISQNVWALKFNRFSAPRKVIDELTKTTAYGKNSVSVSVYKKGILLKELKGVKDADVIKEFTDGLK